MGEVYRAWDSKLKRNVAIKILPERFSRDADRVSRFQREARLLASLNHPNIALIHGLEDSGNTHALVMELVEGPTVADRIRQGPIPIDEALAIAKQICEALEYAHDRGIVHRDLKPANIKLTPSGTVKILDFGLAKALEGTATSVDMSNSPTITPIATQSGILLGTPGYMSPEQARGKPVDRRAGIWSFGCVFYEMLTGRSVFGGETVGEILAEILKSGPDWDRLPAETPQDIRRLLRRCLQKDPNQRLQHIGDARIELNEAKGDSESDGRLAARAFGRREKAGWIVAGVAMLATVALAVVLYIVSRPAEARPQHLSMPLPEDWSLALSSTLGEPTSLVVSPNGRQVAIVARLAAGPATILIRGLDSASARPLAGTEGVTSLFWSPDSRFIGFFADGKIKKVDVSGGLPTVLCVATTPFGGGTWSREGTIVFSMREKGNHRLWKVADSGGQPPVALPDAPAGQETNGREIRPWFLPDGRTILYVVYGRGRQGTVYARKLDSQDRVKVVETESSNVQYANGYLLYLRGEKLMAQPFDQKRLAVTGGPVPVVDHVQKEGTILLPYRLFSVSQNGVLVYQVGTEIATLAWVDRRGQTIGTIGERANYQGIALSHDETRVAAVVGDASDRDLFIVNLSNGVRTPFTFDRSEIFPIWSHDDRFVDFTEVNKPGSSISYRKLSNGSGASERIVPDEERPTLAFDRSSDGSLLVMIPRDHTDLTVLPGSGDRTPFRLASTPQDKRLAKFSPDGRWVAYVSTDDANEQNVWVVPVVRRTGAGDVKYLISGADGGTLPQWSADGRELFYISSSEMLTAVQVNRDGQAFQLGPSKTLFPIRVSQAWGDYKGWHYAVSRDGQRFLVMRSAEEPVSIEVNWTAALKR